MPSESSRRNRSRSSDGPDHSGGNGDGSERNGMGRDTGRRSKNRHNNRRRNHSHGTSPTFAISPDSVHQCSEY